MSFLVLCYPAWEGALQWGDTPSMEPYQNV